jgi:hypothetical protein
MSNFRLRYCGFSFIKVIFQQRSISAYNPNRKDLSAKTAPGSDTHPAVIVPFTSSWA